MTINAENLPNIHRPHTVAIVVFDGVVPYDFSTPCDVFKYVKLETGLIAYDIKVCGVKRHINTGLFGIRAPYTLSSLQDADTIILPGISDIYQEIQESLIHAIRRAFAKGTRIASICSGAFILAATGLLDGLKATTHWQAAPELARRSPTIDVDPNVLYVDNGNLLTSAGASAGLDLCLHIIRRDYGAAVAADSARSAVMPLVREGGQAQFIQYKQSLNDNDSLQPLLAWIEKNLDQDLNVEILSNHTSLSIRSLHRRFVERLGITPANWILNARIRRAQLLLETTRHSIEWISGATGFGSIASFRAQFRKIVGTNPREYRRSFNLIEP